MPSDVEVLIVSYNSAAVIETCLASLARVAPNLPVAVREHGDDPAAQARLRDLVAAHAAGGRLEFDSSNPGFGAGCNALARTSPAGWLMFLNPDTELVTWPWDHGRTPPHGQILGPTMLDSGHAADHSGVSYRLVDEIGRSWFRWRGNRPDGRGFVSGAALLVDAASFQLLGGFDERYFMFYEDIDLCMRANEIGITTVIAPEWSVRHLRAHSTRERFAESLVWSYESGSRFHSSHGTPLALYRLYVIVDAAARWAVHTVRRDRQARYAYRSLARRASSDLIRWRAVRTRT